MKFTMKQIRAHENEKSHDSIERPDFLTRFMQAREKYPVIMSDRRIATFTNTNISAGSDTTAIALREIVYRILSHPGALDQFMAELSGILRARHDSRDSLTSSMSSDDLPITWLEGRSMPYFQALLRECLRCHPPLGQLIPRRVPDGGITLCGQFIPGGVEVGCNAWTIHRDKSVYGADADVFRPERWLEATQEEQRAMESVNFAFGGGPRVCLGKNVALLEISKLVPELFRRYEIKLVDPERYELFPGWLVLQKGLDVTLRRRGDGSPGPREN